MNFIFSSCNADQTVACYSTVLMLIFHTYRLYFH